MITQKVRDIIDRFVEAVSSLGIHVDKAILYGSYLRDLPGGPTYVVLLGVLYAESWVVARILPTGSRRYQGRQDFPAESRDVGGRG